MNSVDTNSGARSVKNPKGPCVSIVVRSMGRPHLRKALESICQQDHATLEVLVVDATGGQHPPLPELPWKAGHVVRLVSTGEPLQRPQAANAGLFAATGEWLCFLDDDDYYDSNFVSAMVRAAQRFPEHLVVYGSSRMVDASGAVTHEFGVPFNRALMFCGPLLYWHAALIQRRVITLGCRFDETLTVCEDRDFLSQIAQHGDFAFVPVTASNYNVTLGTSGTALGENRHPERHIPFESRLRAKWAGSGLYHLQRAAAGSREAVAAYFRGDTDGAVAAFERVLAQYPDDPNALHGLGRIALERRQLDSARKHVARAVHIRPDAAEYRMTLALILRDAGEHELAREHANAAVSEANFRDAALHLLSDLPALPQQALSAHISIASTMTAFSAATQSTVRPPSRMSLCSCGSGLRYKNCHGHIGGLQSTALSQSSTLSAAVREAQHLFARGEANHALARVANTMPTDCDSTEQATIIGEMFYDCGELEKASAWFVRALEINPDSAAGYWLHLCSERQCAPLFAQSVYQEVAHICERLTTNIHALACNDATIHIVATLGNVGGSERHALNLYRTLAAQLPVKLWSLEPPHAVFCADADIQSIDEVKGHFPRGGTLVLVGQFNALGDWFRKTQFQRVVIRNNIDQPSQLLERVTDFELQGHRFQLDFSYPSAQFRARVGLPGLAEYSLTDLSRFRPTVRTLQPQFGSLVVGRHSRDDRLKYHPNDPSFFRRVVRGGHRVRLMGASVIARAISFARSAPEPQIEIVPFASESAVQFLASLHCFIYRAHPHWYETGGNVIAEAMAMQLPVIVVGKRMGIAALIEHGVTGYCVDTEEEALAVLEALANDPALRASIGEKARMRMQRLAAEQAKRITAFYAHPSPIEMPQRWVTEATTPLQLAPSLHAT